MTRNISGLISAWHRPDSPWPDAPTPRGAKGRGLGYEKAVGKALARKLNGRPGYRLVPGPWFSFVDQNGPGNCQMDFLLFTPEGIVVVEVKLTDTFRATEQLRWLYFPILEKISPKPISGLVVCKNLRGSSGEVEWELDKALERVAGERRKIATLHWLGRNPF